MIGLNIWTQGNLKLFCILIGMGFGYGLSLAMGLMPEGAIARISDAPLVWFPLSHHPGFAFSPSLVLPMVIALSIGGLLILFSFCPKLAAVFSLMPEPVIGAANEYAERLSRSQPDTPLHLEARFDKLNLELSGTCPGKRPTPRCWPGTREASTPWQGILSEATRTGLKRITGTAGPRP